MSNSVLMMTYCGINRNVSCHAECLSRPQIFGPYIPLPALVALSQHSVQQHFGGASSQCAREPTKAAACWECCAVAVSVMLAWVTQGARKSTMLTVVEVIIEKVVFTVRLLQLLGSSVCYDKSHHKAAMRSNLAE